MDLGDEPQAVADSIAKLGGKLGDVPSSALVAGFSVTFRRATDNHPVALELAGEILRRNDVDVQKRFVQAFLAALHDYDSGHRAHDDSVFDQLIDDYLPKLQLEPTADLLGRLEPDHLAEDGDDFGALFGPALERAKGTPHEARLMRLATGDREQPPAAKLDGAGRAELVAELGDPKYRLPGASDEIEALHARVRGAKLSRDELARYVKLLIPESNRRDPERVYAVEVMAELGESDFDDLRRRVSSWQLDGKRLAPVLFGVSRLDDARDVYDSALLAKFRSWAFGVDGRPEHPIDDEDIAIRVQEILEYRPSREGRARHWLARATKPVKLESRACWKIETLFEKLLKARLYERVLAWLPLVERLALEPSRVAPLWPMFAWSAGEARRADVLEQLDGSVSREVPYLAMHMYRSFAIVGNEAKAVEWYRRYVALGGFPEPWEHFTLTFARLGAIDALVSGSNDVLARAAYEGADVHDETTRAAVMSGKPEVDPALIDRLVAEGNVAELAEIVLVSNGERPSGGRQHKRLLEVVQAARAPVEIDAQDLQRLFERMRDAGNHAAIVKWMGAFDHLAIGGKDRGDVRAFGIAAAHAAGDRNVEATLIDGASDEHEQRSGTLLLELARHAARSGDRAATMAYVARIPGTFSYEASEALDDAKNDPDLAPYAAEIANAAKRGGGEAMAKMNRALRTLKGEANSKQAAAKPKKVAKPRAKAAKPPAKKPAKPAKKPAKPAKKPAKRSNKPAARKKRR